MSSRRHFLHQAGLTTLALSLPFSDSIAQVLGQQEPKVLRVALMGLGSYASRVAEAMKDCSRAKLVGVISGTPSKIEQSV